MLVDPVENQATHLLVDVVDEEGPVDPDDVRARLLGREHLWIGHRPEHVRDRRREGPEWCQRPLPRFGVACPGHQGHQPGSAVLVGRDERHRRDLHDIGDRRELVGSRLRGGHEPGDHLRRGRQEEHAPDDRRQLVQPVLEARHHPEVAATAANRPEQVGLVLRVGAHQLAVGGDHIGRQDVVDGQAELAGEEADAATHGDAADPHRARVAEPDHETVRAERGRKLAGGQSRLCPDGPARNVDVETLHRRQIEHDAAVARPESDPTVPAAANRELQASVPCEVDRTDDVRIRLGADDHRGTRVLSVDDDPRLVVLGVVRSDDLSGQLAAQVIDRDRSGGGGLVHRASPRLGVVGKPAVRVVLPCGPIPRSEFIADRNGLRDSLHIITVCNDYRKQRRPGRAPGKP